MDVTCDQCGELFSDAGDGYCGLCPSCADNEDEWGQDNWLPPMQELIDTGMAWRLEGHVGRECMRCIEDGQCILGPVDHEDYWGNHIPSRDEVEPGTMGSIEYAQARGWEMPDELRAERAAYYQEKLNAGIEEIGVITRKIMQEES